VAALLAVLAAPAVAAPAKLSVAAAANLKLSAEELKNAFERFPLHFAGTTAGIADVVPASSFLAALAAHRQQASGKFLRLGAAR
jgi:hypothetical protein